MSPFVQQTILPPPEGPLPTTVPTIYCDGIANLANTAEITKMYLYRADPIPSDTNRGQAQIAAQVIMPIASMVNMFVFLERSLNRLAEQGFLGKDQIENERQLLKKGEINVHE